MTPCNPSCSEKSTLSEHFLLWVPGYAPWSRLRKCILSICGRDADVVFFLWLCRTTWIKRTKESGRAMQQDHKQFERSLNFQLPKQRTTARVCGAEGTGCSGWLAFSLHTGTAAHLLPETGRLGASPFHHWQAVSGHLTLLSQTTLLRGKRPPEQAKRIVTYS